MILLIRQYSCFGLDIANLVNFGTKYYLKTQISKSFMGSSTAQSLSISINFHWGPRMERSEERGEGMGIEVLSMGPLE